MWEQQDVCNSRALPPSDFYFLTSECRNLQFKGFEKIRGKEGMWFEINPHDIPVQSFFFPDFCGECYVTCGCMAEHACEHASSEPLPPPPFVNRNSCFFPQSSLRFFLFSPVFSSVGGTVFEAFLRSEFSEENLQFYKACEQYSQSSNKFSLQRRAKMIAKTYIQPGAPREVDLSKSVYCIKNIASKMFKLLFLIQWK